MPFWIGAFLNSSGTSAATESTGFRSHVLVTIEPSAVEDLASELLVPGSPHPASPSAPTTVGPASGATDRGTFVDRDMEVPPVVVRRRVAERRSAWIGPGLAGDRSEDSGE